MGCVVRHSRVKLRPVVASTLADDISRGAQFQVATQELEGFLWTYLPVASTANLLMLGKVLLCVVESDKVLYWCCPWRYGFVCA